MVKKSITKIKEAENKAERIVVEAEKTVADSVVSEKRRWEKELDKIKEAEEVNLATKLETAKKEAGGLKKERESEIDSKMSAVEDKAKTNVDKAVQLLVDKMLAV
ncbi:MAG: hypothetical protein HQ530_01045 [Parcubacteria group bacterium]|nr:hypothetical protein [Parcubacteria group bacterium]